LLDYAAPVLASQPEMTDHVERVTLTIQAKKFVESCPQVLKENLPKEDAEKLQKTLEALGATISLS
jgi:ribosomal protein L7/L12